MGDVASITAGTGLSVGKSLMLWLPLYLSTNCHCITHSKCKVPEDGISWSCLRSMPSFACTRKVEERFSSGKGAVTLPSPCRMGRSGDVQKGGQGTLTNGNWRLQSISGEYLLRIQWKLAEL